MIQTRLLQLVIAGLICTSGARMAHAIPVLFSFGDEKIIKVYELPEIDLFFNTETKTYMDVGWRYKQVTIFFMPVWNYDGAYCGYAGLEDTYVDVNLEQFNEVAAMANIPKIEVPDEPELPFWDVVGGKLAVGGLLLLLIGLQVLLRKRK